MGTTGCVQIKQVTHCDPALVSEIRRVGVNLNQITRAVHQSGGALPPELDAMQASVDAALRRVLLV
jgi:hypothetical protein